MAVGAVTGLTDSENAVFNELWQMWTRKTTRNRLRQQYYNQRNVLKDLGISIPPDLTSLELVLGWPAKAVDVLARRCRLDGFAVPGSDLDRFGVDELWRENDMDVELPQALTSALTQSCSFLMVTKGGVGEPEVLISSQSALYGAGLWDYRLRRLRAVLSIQNTNEIGRVTEFVMFLPRLTIHGAWDRSWTIERFPHTLDRLPVEVLPYKPHLDRPFGTSRVSRAVMGLADSALRTLFRMEISAEFYSAPQRWIMGADESMFVDPDGKPKTQWQAIMGRVWAAPYNDDAQITPTVGQFNAATQQPHIEQLRSLASAFAAETSLPLSALGIVQDNPSSAEAIEAAERDLIIEAEYATDTFGPRLSRIVQTAVQIRDNLDAVPKELLKLDARWRDPSNPTQSAAADAVSKVVAALPFLAESRVTLERLGWDEATIDRAWADKRKAGTTMLMQQLRTSGGVGAGAATPADTGQPASGSRP